MRQSLNNMRVVVHLDHECICQVVCKQLATKGALEHYGVAFVVYKGVIAIW
jgi:hypothetical protein